jgi:PAS domain S-box-containing protein
MDRQPGVEKDITNIQRVTLLYLLLASIWIIFSDTFLGWLVSDIAIYARLQTYKGWAFVLVTGSLFYLYLKPRIEALKRSQRVLLETKQELHESEEKYRGLINGMNDTVWVIDFDGRIIDVNDSSANVLGYSREELLSMTLQNIDAALSPEEIRTLVGRMKTDRTQLFGTVHVAKDGTKIPVEINSSLVAYKGKPAILSIARDVTERRLAEEKMQYLLDMLKRTGEMAKVGGWEFDAETLQGSWTEEVARIHDMGPLDPTNVSTGLDFYTEASKQIIGGAINEAIKNAIPYDLELQMLTAKGNTKWVRSIGRPVIEDGKVKKVVGSFQDITEHKQTQERELHLKEVLLGIRNVNQLITKETDPAQLIEKACQNLTETLGYYSAWIAVLNADGAVTATASSGLSDKFEALDKQLQHGVFPGCMKAALGKKQVLIIDTSNGHCSDCPLEHEYSDHAVLCYRLQHNDNLYGILTVSVPAEYACMEEEQYLFTEVADDLGFAFYKFGIETQRRYAEQTIRELNQFNQFTLDSLGANICVLDETGTIIKTNRSWKAFAIANSADLEKVCEGINYIQTAKNAMGPDSDLALQFSRGIEDVMNGSAEHFELEYPCHSPHEQRWFLGKVSPFEGTDSFPRKVVISHTNITERTQVQKALEKQNSFIQAILDNLPIGLAVNEFDGGNASYMNARFSDIYGWPEEELTDVSRFFELVYPDPHYRKGIMGRIMSDISSGDPSRMHWDDISIQTKGKGKRWVSAVNIPILGQNMMVSTVQDVTERKQAEEDLKRRLGYELATVECMRLLIQSEDMDAILPRILDIVHRNVGDSRSYIFQNEEDPELGLCMSQKYEVVGEGITRQIDNPVLNHLPYSEGSPTLLAALQSRKHYAHVTEELEDPDRTILAEQGILSVLILPIFSGPDLWGFIGFDDCVKARHWHEGDISLLWVVADGIGEAVLRKSGEKALKESEERFKALHNASFGGIIIHDKGVILDCNQGLSEISGYPVEELIGMDGLLLIAEQSRETVTKNVLCGFEEPYEVIGLRKDGTEYPTRLEAKNIPYKGKEVRVVEFRDITDQKKAEQAVRESEAKLSAMIANISDVIAIIDKDGINSYKSPNIEKWFGWRPEDVIGVSTWENIHPDDLSRVQEVFATILDNTKDTVTAESRYRCKDGSYKWMEFTANNLLHDSTIKGVLLNYHDITNRKQAEDALRQSERKFRNYIANAPYGIFIADKEGNYLEVNKTACTLTGYSEDELTGMNRIDLIAPEFRYRAGQSFEEVKNTGSDSVELSCMRKDGTFCWLRIDATRLSETRYLVFASDITERKKAEYSLIEAKMMAEENSRIKSEFLANMSHELRTPLTAVIGFSDILSIQRFGELNSKQLEYVEHILKSGKHLLDVINDVLDLSKVEAGKMELDCEIFSVSELLEEVQRSLYPLSVRKNIEIDLMNDVREPEIFADKLKLKQIMYNLLSNAIKFTPDNGKVSVAARQSHDTIEISVSDTGIGIPENRLEEIFDPFMQVDASNKRRYGGTGLGLALARRFVEMHGGSIRVESEEGKGSTFTFSIVDQKQAERVDGKSA